MISRQDLAKYPIGSFDYVLMHSIRQRQRGRGLSATFPHMREPRSALKLAKMFAYFTESGGEYLEGKIPEDYVCAECGVFGHKLWRDHAADTYLLCALCAAANQKKNIIDIDANGRWTSELATGNIMDQQIGNTETIGWFVPAVPIEDGSGYWSFSFVPRVARIWWYKLPTLPPDRDLSFLKAFSRKAE